MKIERNDCCHNKCVVGVPVGTVFEHNTHIYIKSITFGGFNAFNVTTNVYAGVNDEHVVRVYPNAKLVLEP